MSNFDFIPDKDGDFSDLYWICYTAEQSYGRSYKNSALNARAALDYMVNLIFQSYEWKTTEEDGEDKLFNMLKDERFCELIDCDALNELHKLRMIGNEAAHGTRRISEEAAHDSLEILYYFVGDIFCHLYSIEDFPEFDWNIVPQKPISDYNQVRRNSKSNDSPLLGLCTTSSHRNSYGFIVNDIEPEIPARITKPSKELAAKYADRLKGVHLRKRR